MRRSISKIPYRPTTATSSIAAALSTSSGGGGRGRGAPTHFQFTVDTPPEDESENSNCDGAPPPPHGHGRGRGVPPLFSSSLNNDKNSAAFGQGRNIGFVSPNSFSPPREEFETQPPQPNPKKNLHPGLAHSRGIASSQICFSVTANMHSGKLRAQRAKSMKFKDGYMISSGQPVKEYIDSAVRHVLLRQGVLGIKVNIMLDWDSKGKLGPITHLPDIVIIHPPKEEEAFRPTLAPVEVEVEV